MYILDDSAPYDLHPMPTFNAGNSVPYTVCNEEDSVEVWVVDGCAAAADQSSPMFTFLLTTTTIFP